MIVPMKKASIILLSKDAEDALKELRHLGMLHIEHTEVPHSKDISLLQEDMAILDAAIEIFNKVGLDGQKKDSETKMPADWRQGARHVLDLWKRYDQLESYSRVLINGIEELKKWDDFDPHEIQKLAQKGIFVKLYQVSLKQLNDFPEDAVVKKIFISGDQAGCVVISRRRFECPFKEIPLPKQSLSSMHARLVEDKKAIGAITKQVKQMGQYYSGFLSLRRQLEKEMEFHQALAGMGKAGSIFYITGYVPYDAMDKLTETAKTNKWGLLISEPSEDDKVPTLIRNPRWVSLIKPVFKLLEVVPGYKELDISLPFLIFFSIFFGMLIGDAGYGVIYLLLTFFVQKKYGKSIRDKSAFFLFYILSSCAITWGLLTGSFFGQEWLKATMYKPLLPALNDTKNIQTFCFFLGALHLSIAHSWRAVLKFPSFAALADVGWTCILWTAYLLARTLILGYAFPHFGKWLILFGIGLVIFFTNPQKNILKGVGNGLGTLALSLMNNFTDVVSYVRLFAVGLAGVAIADTFNSMAKGIGTGNILGLFISGLILVAGHGLNLVLGPMSVLVHGVRLNVLEFCGHVNVSWSGFLYKPFKE